MQAYVIVSEPDHDMFDIVGGSTDLEIAEAMVENMTTKAREKLAFNKIASDYCREERERFNMDRVYQKMLTESQELADEYWDMAWKEIERLTFEHMMKIDPILAQQLTQGQTMFRFEEVAGCYRIVPVELS